MASDLEDLVIETIQNKRKVTQKDKWTRAENHGTPLRRHIYV